HAYFLIENPSAQSYKDIMANKVLPLLQEYFYENWESIELVLGGAGKKADDPDFFLGKTKLTRNVLFGKISDQSYEQEKYRYSVHPNPTHKALIRIYEKAVLEDSQDDDQDEVG